MSVKIDTVYQRVLGILNKEQRGYLTPQEFNLFANQAQMDLFEQYFYDINQFGRIPGNDTEYSDMLNMLNEKINLFETTQAPNRINNHFELPADLYRLGAIIYSNLTTNSFGQLITEPIEVEKINAKDFLYINSSPLTKPKNVRPVYVANSQGFKVYGDVEITNDIEINYIKRPARVEWRYQTVFGEALYDAQNSVDFELHSSEEVELVYKILELAGLSINDINMYSIANSEEQETIQQEKA